MMHKLFCKKKPEQNLTNGFAALFLLIAIGGISVTISVAVSLLAYFISQNSYGMARSTDALLAAQSGADDAIIKVLRDPSIAITPASPYVLALGLNHEVEEIICNGSKSAADFCDTPNSGEIEITSTGKAEGKERRIRAYVIYDQVTGELFVKSYSEIPL